MLQDTHYQSRDEVGGSRGKHLPDIFLFFYEGILWRHDVGYYERYDAERAMWKKKCKGVDGEEYSTSKERDSAWRQALGRMRAMNGPKKRSGKESSLPHRPAPLQVSVESPSHVICPPLSREPARRHSQPDSASEVPNEDV